MHFSRRNLVSRSIRPVSLQFIFGTLLVIGLVGQEHVAVASTFVAHPITAQQCATFKTQLQARQDIATHELIVPRQRFNRPSGQPPAETKIFFWTRQAQSPASSFPPLLLIHGGVGGQSSAMLQWKSVIDQYPGLVVVPDLRGEGCSNDFAYAQRPEAFAHVSIEETLHDLEEIRRSLGLQRWRIFGQSRGSAIVHRYLAFAPDSIESAIAHGLAMLSSSEYPDYSITRSRFSVRAGREFVRLHPKTDAILRALRLRFANECFAVNFELSADPALPQDFVTVCGEHVVDALSGRLGARSGWGNLAQQLEELSLVDGQLDIVKARRLLQNALDTSLYTRFMSYILGTNSLEFHAPDFSRLAEIALDPFMSSAPLSEGRFIHEVIRPLWQTRYPGPLARADHKPYPFAQVRSALEQRQRAGDPLRVNVFMGDFDPVAGPEAFSTEMAEWQGVANFHLLPNSAHDGWRTEAAVANVILQP